MLLTFTKGALGKTIFEKDNDAQPSQILPPFCRNLLGIGGGGECSDQDDLDNCDADEILCADGNGFCFVTVENRRALCGQYFDDTEYLGLCDSDADCPDAYPICAALDCREDLGGYAGVCITTEIVPLPTPTPGAPTAAPAIDDGDDGKDKDKDKDKSRKLDLWQDDEDQEK